MIQGEQGIITYLSKIKYTDDRKLAKRREQSAESLLRVKS